MITRRIAINLVAFLALLAALLVWAATTVVRIDAIERPVRVDASFDTSPGLRSGFEVSYLGLRVGTIGDVELVDGTVRVELEIDRGVDLPAELDATVRRKSAVGEPYVDLSPTGGTDRGGDRVHEVLRDDRAIPLERTTTPLSYSALFSALDQLLRSVPRDDLVTVVDELATALDGRAPALRTLLQSTADLTGTLAEDAELLDQLTVELTRVTRTLTERREALGGAVDDLALLSETLAANRESVAALLDRTPTFTEDLAEVLAATEADLGCTLDALGTTAGGLDTVGTLDALRRVLASSGQAAGAVDGTLFETDSGRWINGEFVFNVGESTVPVYPEPRQLPTPPPLPTCERQTTAAPGAGPASPVAQPGDVADGVGDSPAPEVGREGEQAGPAGPSSELALGDGGPDVGVVLRLAGGIALLAVLAAAVHRIVTRKGPAAAGPAALTPHEDDAGGELDGDDELVDDQAGGPPRPAS